LALGAASGSEETGRRSGGGVVGVDGRRLSGWERSTGGGSKTLGEVEVDLARQVGVTG
jgi:hypothetical protein